MFFDEKHLVDSQSYKLNVMAIHSVVAEIFPLIIENFAITQSLTW